MGAVEPAAVTAAAAAAAAAARQVQPWGQWDLQERQQQAGLVTDHIDGMSLGRCPVHNTLAECVALICLAYS